jgi:hypothetical protein
MAKRESLRRQMLQEYLEKTDEVAAVVGKPGPDPKSLPGLEAH